MHNYNINVSLFSHLGIIDRPIDKENSNFRPKVLFIYFVFIFPPNRMLHHATLNNRQSKIIFIKPLKKP